MLTQTVRIIGGKWRGRKLSFPQVDSLRPTPDRVRETVFNWLKPYLLGAHCLDCFAGSGALGLEAISRGAQSAVLIDSNPSCCEMLSESIKQLDANTAHVKQSRVPGAGLGSQTFHIVFIDPPYDDDLIKPTLAWLIKSQHLSKDAVIYLESQKPLKEEDLAPDFTLLKAKKAGQVYYHLAQYVMSDI